MIYSMEELIKTFSVHDIESIKIRQECLDLFRKHSPGEEPPKHMLDNFNFPAALKSICEEILKLKEGLMENSKKIVEILDEQ